MDKRYRNYSFIYTIIFAIIAYIGFGMLTHNGKSLVWSIDSVGQFYPVFKYIGQYIREYFHAAARGQWHIPMYDMSIGMGEGIIGAFNYYGFGDPINLLSVFANDSNIELIFSFSYILRIYLAGLAFMHYCDKIHIGKEASLVGALCYAYSGFAICGGLMYIAWMSVLIYFPFMLSGIEDIIQNKRKIRNLALSVLYAALCGFYYLYMSSLVLIVYCLVRFIFVYSAKARTEEDTRRRQTAYTIKHTLSSCIYCACVYVSGILVASPIFILSVRAFMGSERTTDIFDIIFNYHYYVPHLSTLVSSLKSTVIPDRYNIALGAYVIEWISAVILFIKCRGRRYLQLKIGVVLSIIAMSVNITGYLFNAFSENNGRWIFIVHFLFAVILSQLVCDMGSKLSGKKRAAAVTIVTVLVAANILFNFYGLFSERFCNWQEEFIASEELPLYLKSPCGRFETISDDDDFFRVATTLFTDVNGRPENLAMLNGYYGMTYWYSIANKNVQKDVDEYNDETMNWRSYGFNDNPEAMTVMGVKYLVSDKTPNEKVADDFVKIEEAEFNNNTWSLYENKNYFGAAYVISPDTDLTGDFDSRMNALYEEASKNSARVDKIKYNNRRNVLSVDVADGDEAILVTAIPYDSRWKAAIDGEETATRQIDMFVAVDIPGSEHKIEFTY